MTSEPISHPPLPRRLVLLMAAATGLAVASNYYAQPLLETLAQAFQIQVRTAGAVVTAAQLAYAAGLLLLVPLGDRLERRGLIVGLFVLSALGLLVSAASHSFGMLLAGTIVTGASSVAAQILVARTAAGLLAGVGGWHTVYWIAAALLLLTAGLLWRGLPRHPGNAQLSYPQLVGSVLTLLRDDAVLRSRSVLGGLLFAGFSMFWTTLAFLLSGPGYGYGTAVIGLFGLIGAAGALAANRSGHWSDHGHGDRVSWGGLVMLLLSWGLLAFAPHSIVLLIIGVLLLDIAVQGVHIANQSVIYQRNPHARNRITSAYITCYFIGGAVGSTLGTAAYAQAGWNGVVIGGAVLALAALGWVALSVARGSWK